MGIEQMLERFAAALERIAAANEGIVGKLSFLVECADFHKKRAERLDGGNVCPPAELKNEEAPAEPEFSYDELKAKLVERGVEIPKGTKMTTLLKLWDKYKDAPVASDEPEAAPAEEAVEAPAAEADIFADGSTDPMEEAPAPAAGIPSDLDPVKAKEVIQRYYDRSPADCAAVKEALALVGAATYGEIPAGKHGIVLARFLELKGINVAEVEL